jgi:preprotein translocase subunit SecY
MAGPQVPNLFKIPELRRKILFTLAVLVLLRVGSHITVPGVNQEELTLAAGGQNNLFGLLDLFTGGALQKATVFALGIMPYISSSIIFQLLTAVFPYFEKLQKEGEEGRKKIQQYTRYATLGLAAVQAAGYAVFIQNLSPDAILFPGIRFQVLTILVLTTGAVFVMWLGEQITEKGIGNGMSLIIFFGIIEAFPNAAAQIWTLWRTEVIGIFTILAFLVIMIAIVAATVTMTMAVRKIPIQIPRKVVGRNRIRQGQKTHLPLRINSAGVMPIIFAQSIMFLPPTVGAFFPNAPLIQRFAGAFQFGSVWYIVVFTAMIVFFTYFYTAIIFNPVDLA